MKYQPENTRSPEQSAQRETLIATLGDRALLSVIMPESTDLRLALDEQVGAKQDSPRRAELFPAIAALGGQTLTAVDVVLGVQNVVDDYKHQRGIIVEVIEDQMVPQYLSVITRDANKAVRDACRSIWRNIRDERYPKPENRYQRRMATKKFNASRSASLRQSQAARSQPDIDF